jgi:predicted DNA-binding protein YlxM (UPF0122 family)
MNKVNEQLSNVLGIEYEKEPEIIKVVPEVESMLIVSASDIEDDYNLARKTIKDLIKKGNDVIDDMAELARQSESPRAYEVLSTMIKTISETTKDLYDIHKKTKEIRETTKGKPTDPNITVEKAVFVGTTAELLKRVKEEKK